MTVMLLLCTLFHFSTHSRMFTRFETLLLHVIQSNEGVRAIVLSPTRELATQIGREFDKLARGKKFRSLVLSKVANMVMGVVTWAGMMYTLITLAQVVWTCAAKHTPYANRLLY